MAETSQPWVACDRPGFSHTALLSLKELTQEILQKSFPTITIYKSVHTSISELEPFENYYIPALRLSTFMARFKASSMANLRLQFITVS